MTAKFPFIGTKIPEDELAERAKYWTKEGSQIDIMAFGPKNVYLPVTYQDFADQIYNFECRKEDIFVLTPMKCGTTLTQEMVWQIVHGFDIENGKLPLWYRSPFLELTTLINHKHFDDEKEVLTSDNNAKYLFKMSKDSLKWANEIDSPRVLKSHLPLDFLPPRLLDKTKIVFVARNPKDVCVSQYHHSVLFKSARWDGPFEKFVEFFKNGKLVYGDYFNILLQAWSMRDHPNMKFLWFEDIIKDLKGTIETVSAHIGYELPPNKIDSLSSHLHFDNFKKNPAVNQNELEVSGKDFSFIRKGIVGDYKNFFDEDRIKDFNDWIRTKVDDDEELLNRLII